VNIIAALIVAVGLIIAGTTIANAIEEAADKMEALASIILYPEVED
jgi:hypothetical protein